MAHGLCGREQQHVPKGWVKVMTHYPLSQSHYLPQSSETAVLTRVERDKNLSPNGEIIL